MTGVLRQPAYTGSNRCLPCTVLNVGLVLVAAALLLHVSPEAAIVVVFAGFTATYLQGYVVPGTPTLTKRYLPDWVRRWVGKQPNSADRGAGVTTDEQPVDVPGGGATVGLDGGSVEETLLDSQALVPCWDGTDLCLSGDFQRRWDRALRELPPDPVIDLTPLVGSAHADSAMVDGHPPAVTLSVDDTQVGWWPSSAAFRADAAGAIVLSRTIGDWASYDFAERASILAGLRLWLERCPNCAGRVILGEDTVESCCSTREVVALHCADCGIRLLEAPQH